VWKLINRRLQFRGETPLVGEAAFVQLMPKMEPKASPGYRWYCVRLTGTPHVHSVSPARRNSPYTRTRYKTCRIASLSNLVPDTSMNILDPQGPIAAADKTILIDSIAIMLAIVGAHDCRDLRLRPGIFARIQHPALFYWPRLGNIRGRLELVVWSIPALNHHPTSAVCCRLDRLAISSIPQDLLRGPGKAITIPSRVSLDWEMAIHLFPDQRIAEPSTRWTSSGRLAPCISQLTSGRSVMNVFLHFPQLGSNDLHHERHPMVTRLELRADNIGESSGHFGAFFPVMAFPK